MSQFQFVGQSDTVTSKISWPVLAQGLVIRASIVDKLPAPQAFARGVAEFNAQADEADQLPTELPQSYTNKNAGSVLYGMRTRFLKRVNTESARGHEETRAVAVELGLIQEVESNEDASEA